MVHHVELGGDILVKIRLWQIVRHVVEEVDVPERPAGVIPGLWTHLEILKIEVKKDQWEWSLACVDPPLPSSLSSCCAFVGRSLHPRPGGQSSHIC